VCVCEVLCAGEHTYDDDGEEQANLQHGVSPKVSAVMSVGVEHGQTVHEERLDDRQLSADDHKVKPRARGRSAQHGHHEA
jgi:hypothetical protein